MLDIRLIREQPDFVRKKLETRGVEFILEHLLADEKSRRLLLAGAEQLRARRNQLSKEIGALIGQKKLEEAEAKKANVRQLNEKIDELNWRAVEAEAQINKRLKELPNLPHSTVPLGKRAADNPEVRRWGEQPKFPFKPKSHIELCEKLGLIDFARATKLSGSGFLLYTGWGAKLERALIQFLLDLHTKEHGYTEVSPPFIIRKECMEGVGQFPMFVEQAYAVRTGIESVDYEGKLGEAGDDLSASLFLIPTAEAPVANIHREEILKESQLPIYY